MNYEDMNKHQINKLVARSLGVEWIAVASDGLIIDGQSASVDYCNNPSDAWPIIVESKITICPDVYIEVWYGQKDIDRGMDGDSIHVTEDKNPLRAAMICFLKMKDAES